MTDDQGWTLQPLPQPRTVTVNADDLRVLLDAVSAFASLPAMQARRHLAAVPVQRARCTLAAAHAEVDHD